MIEDYKFGKIKIKGKTYTEDVEVRWAPKTPSATGQALQVLDWWREKGHVFALSDLERALEREPDVVVLGTGAYGRAKVTKELKQEMEDRGIKLVIDKTGKAVESFNLLLEKSEKVIGLFHLTC